MIFLARLSTYWKKIESFGAETNSRENEVISLINQMGLIGGTGCMVMAGISIWIGSTPAYTLMAVLFGLFIFAPVVFNFYGKTEISKFIIAGIHPLITSFYILLCGGSIGEESILIISLFMIFILYKDKANLMLRFYLAGGISYVCAEIYTFNYAPIVPVIDNPYDNFLAFLISTIWLFMVLWMYQKQVNRQKGSQEILINELQTKNASLKKTTKELEQFTYIASHDLKSPLRTIISFLDLIKRDVNRERYDDLLSKLDFARSGAEQMNYLVTDILEYSKITSGNKRKKKMVNLQVLADKVRFNLTDVIQKKNVDLYIFPLTDFYCNETEMTVLFQNFIENGIKYNEEATPNIFVKSKVENGHLILQFIDNGIGIEEQYFDKIFLFFKRLHTNDYYQGTGLGLGLCKKIIDDMGGTVSLKSTVNVGSTFTISLPIEASTSQVISQKVVSEVH